MLVNTSQQLKSDLFWHICWLNNNGKPVIGLLPKTAWTALPITTNDRHINNNKHTNNQAIDSSRQPKRVQNWRGQNCVRIIKSTRNFTQQTPTCQTNTVIFDDWINALIAYSTQHNDSQKSIVKPDNTYRNGLMGFIGYDITAKNLSPDSNISIAEQPCAFMAHYDIYLMPNAKGSWQLFIDENTEQDAIDTVLSFLDIIDSQTSKGSHSDTAHSASTSDLQVSLMSAPALTLTNRWHYQQYESAFKQTQKYLYQGDSYQINLTQKWQGQLGQIKTEQHTSVSARLVNYLPRLYTNTQAPYAGYLNVDGLYQRINSTNQHVDSHSNLRNFELLSCSPELFVQFNKGPEGQQFILTKPIKGTVPRGYSAEQDEQLKRQLANSEKDKAENVMIVDLLRNDLGKYAKTGSVKVPKLFAIETFSNVHHMVSSITATIKQEYHPLTVLFDSLPAGSITGTPKKRAVEIINELESDPRGAYCGTMGYLNFDGTGQWNVLIRTLQADEVGQVALWAGGGITVGSECAAEYQESHDKVSNLIRILNPETGNSNRLNPKTDPNN